MTLLRWLRRFMTDVRGSAALEKTLMVGTAVAVGATFGAGAVGAGSASSAAAKKQVTRSAIKSRVSVQGPVQLFGGLATGPLTIVREDDEISIAENKKVPIVSKVEFDLRNSGQIPYELRNVTISYQDDTQKIALCNTRNVQVSGRRVTCDRVTFLFVRGVPVKGGSATRGIPAIAPRDGVEVSVDLSGLTNRLSTSTDVHITFDSLSGDDLTVNLRTPEQLRPVMSLK